MSELYDDSLPPMETEDTFTSSSAMSADSCVGDVDGNTPSLDSSIEVPKLLAEIVKPPTPPPEPVQSSSSVVCRSSSLSSLQQSLINEIKNKHQATTSDVEEASGFDPVVQQQAVAAAAASPTSSDMTNASGNSNTAGAGVTSTGFGTRSSDHLPLDEDNGDEPNRERPLIVHCETKNSAAGPLSANATSSGGGTTSSGNSNPQQNSHPAAGSVSASAPASASVPMRLEDLAPPQRLCPAEQPTQIIGGARHHQQSLAGGGSDDGQSPLNGERGETAVCGATGASAAAAVVAVASVSSNTPARNEIGGAMAVLHEVVVSTNMSSADALLTTNGNGNHQDASMTRANLSEGVYNGNNNNGGEETGTKEWNSASPVHDNGPSTPNSGTGSTMEDLEGLNLNLASIKSQFEKKDKADNDQTAKGPPALDRSASSRSDVLRKRLERYQSVVAGEAKAESSDDEEDGDHVDSSKKIAPCREIGELKAQWESGRVSNDNGSATADAESAHDKVSPGLSKTMKVAYEKAIKESHIKESKTSPPEELSQVGHALANTLKKKFESGEVVKEEEAERLEAVRSEKEDDLSVCQDPVIAQQAKLMFQKIDKEIASRPAAPPTTGLVRTPSDSRWSRASFGETTKDVDVVHGSDPGYKEQVEVETAALSERYRFFENYTEEAASVKKKKFQMTPPRELGPHDREASPPPACERDPNVVVGSITTDDIPNVDTATKMRQKFETLCQSGGAQEPVAKVCQTPKPRPLKKASLDSSPPQVPATSPHVIEDDCMPADNITRNMRAVFERNNIAERTNDSGQPSPPASAERTNTPKVSRFVFGTPNTEICSMCQGKVFPMERREVSGLVMHTKCFKCTRCNINLRLDGYSQKGGKLYCEAHYQQLFKVKGNYDEGFGCEKWSRTPSPSAHDAPPTPLNLPPAASNQTLIA